MKGHLTKKFGTLPIPSDFHFWNLVNAAFSSRAVIFFHFQNLVNAAFCSSTVMFSHFCLFNFSFPFSIFPIQLADILQFFFSPYSFPELFYIILKQCFFTINWFLPIALQNFLVSVWKILFCLQNLLRLSNHFSFCAFTCIFCFTSSQILGISMALVILYFLVTFLAFLVFGSLFLSISLSIDISPLIVLILFSILVFHFDFFIFVRFSLFFSV